MLGTRRLSTLIGQLMFRYCLEIYLNNKSLKRKHGS